MWARPKASSHLWIEVQVPVESVTDTLANTLILRPFPALCHDLASVEIYSQSGNLLTLSGSSLSFLPGYSAVSGRVEAMGDIRLFFPPTAVSAFRLHIVPGDYSYWGFSGIHLRTTSFLPGSTLSLDLEPLADGKTLSGVSAGRGASGRHCRLRV
jgi:hypothetical protein